MLKVRIVQQGVWHMEKESMPLAAGYLAATLQADTEISGQCDIAILNFPGNASPMEMAIDLLKDSAPDIVGFSVLGWNVRQFAAVAETIKQANPSALIVFGGNHVANQAARTFRLYDDVDVVVHGEGEIPFRELVRATLEGRSFDQIR